MKKTLIAFAALSAIAGMAQAQSTVTLYGLLDANINSFKTNSFDATTNQASSRSQTNISSGGLNGSRFGFRITEDLGGGLSAIGNLEGGLDIDTGKSAHKHCATATCLTVTMRLDVMRCNGHDFG